jgi:hypothetical protein
MRGLQGQCPRNMIHIHIRTHELALTSIHDYLQASNTRCACSGIEGMSPGNMIHIHIRTHEPAPIIHDYLQAPNTRCACSGLEGMSPRNMMHIHIRTHVQTPTIIHVCVCIYRHPILDVHAVVLKECVCNASYTYAHTNKHQPLYVYV